MLWIMSLDNLVVLTQQLTYKLREDVKLLDKNLPDPQPAGEGLGVHAMRRQRTDKRHRLGHHLPVSANKIGTTNPKAAVRLTVD